jgi:hypothetical protein
MRSSCRTATCSSAGALPDGHVFVGWGAIPYATEFDAAGRMIFDLSFGKGIATITGANQDADSYRVYRLVWHGHPTNNPAIRIRGNRAYVSWNGATEVARWQVELDGRPAATAPKRGFETALPIGGNAHNVAVVALSTSGRELGRSKTITR